jgi:hypothetical protein
VRKGAPAPPFKSRYGTPGASLGALAIGYALLPFFAKNLLISAFVGSRKQCWLCPARAVPIGVGEPCTKWLVRNH